VVGGCPGTYKAPTVIHTVKHWGELFLIDRVPPEAFNVCGDPPAGALAPETLRGIEALLTPTSQPIRTVPCHKFA
jgi:hypothetical protein